MGDANTVLFDRFMAFLNLEMGVDMEDATLVRYYARQFVMLHCDGICSAVDNGRLHDNSLVAFSWASNNQ